MQYLLGSRPSAVPVPFLVKKGAISLSHIFVHPKAQGPNDFVWCVKGRFATPGKSPIPQSMLLAYIHQG